MGGSTGARRSAPADAAFGRNALRHRRALRRRERRRAPDRPVAVRSDVRTHVGRDSPAAAGGGESCAAAFPTWASARCSPAWTTRRSRSSPAATMTPSGLRRAARRCLRRPLRRHDQRTRRRRTVSLRRPLPSRRRRLCTAGRRPPCRHSCGPPTSGRQHRLSRRRSRPGRDGPSFLGQPC